MTDLVGKRVRVKMACDLSLAVYIGLEGVVSRSLAGGRLWRVDLDDGEIICFFAKELEVLDASNPST